MAHQCNEPAPSLNYTRLILPSISSVDAIQSFLYNNAGFNKLRKLPQLEDGACRYDPAVIPVAESTSNQQYAQTDILRAPPQDVSGRFYSVSDFHDAYKSGRLTPGAVVEALLPLIRRDVEKRSQHSTAFLDTKVDLVIRTAEASTQRYKEGKPLGCLDGVPVAVKDEVDLKGYKKCLGSKKDFTNKLHETSWCVTKWEEQGAIVLGKLNMHELGLGG